MPITVASWNIEKNGKSSDPLKQAKVSEFIDICCKDFNISVIFLCEVHSAQTINYIDFLNATYKEYRAESLEGGMSNAYVVLVRRDIPHQISYDTLKALNRTGLFIQFPKLKNLALVLAHFKSGQTGLTKSQLDEAADFLTQITMSTGNQWAITGDMNWDYSRVGELRLGHGVGYTCWIDQTHVKGGILDWCFAGGATTVQPLTLTGMFKQETFDMSGPDHRPVIFSMGD